jgi:hypothetical protein
VTEACPALVGDRGSLDDDAVEQSVRTLMPDGFASSERPVDLVVTVS